MLIQPNTIKVGTRVRVFDIILWYLHGGDCKEHNNDCFYLDAKVVSEVYSDNKGHKHPLVDVVYEHFPNKYKSIRHDVLKLRMD